MHLEERKQPQAVAPFGILAFFRSSNSGAFIYFFNVGAFYVPRSPAFCTKNSVGGLTSLLHGLYMDQQGVEKEVLTRWDSNTVILATQYIVSQLFVTYLFF